MVLISPPKAQVPAWSEQYNDEDNFYEQEDEYKTDGRMDMFNNNVPTKQDLQTYQEDEN